MFVIFGNLHSSLPRGHSKETLPPSASVILARAVKVFTNFMFSFLDRCNSAANSWPPLAG